MTQKVTNTLTALLKFAEGSKFKIKGHAPEYLYNKEAKAVFKSQNNIFYCDVIHITESSFTIGTDLFGQMKKVRIFYDELIFTEDSKKK
jgi:hypothetical protein